MAAPEEMDEAARKTLDRARAVGHLKVGDAVERVLPGERGKPDTRDGGRVVKVSDTEVVAVIALDIERTMRYDRSTGVNLEGPDYGYLEARVVHQAARAGADGTQSCVRCGKALRRPPAKPAPEGAPMTDGGHEITQTEARGALLCPTANVPVPARGDGRW
jgi:hypothetical protein